MDENFVGMKELYDVNLRLLKPLEIGNKKYDINESILSFAKVEMAQIQQDKRTVEARGGYHNPALVNWEVDREMQFLITNGVLSPVSYALLSNSKLKQPQYKSVQYNESVHVIEGNNYLYVDLKFCPNAVVQMGAQPNPNLEPLPMGRRPELLLKPLPPSKTKWIFIYNKETGQKIHDFQIYQNRIFLREQAKEVIVDYTFTYEDKIRVIEVGNRLLNGFLRLDGKMSIKDEKSGKVTTGIMEMPKIRLSSDLTIQLGSSYGNSTVSNFHFTGFIDESERRDQQKIAKITFLDTELTGDYI